MSNAAEHFDVIIVGAGLSGIGAAHRLSVLCPRKTYVVLEAREQVGGTWDLWRYPGVRSDSDMFTMSYPFKLWESDTGLVSGSSIKDYLTEVAADKSLDKHIRCGHRVNKAAWSAAGSKWTVETTGGCFTCSFLYLGSGYYEYDEGYTPDFPGLSEFRGRFVHPIRWPEDLNHAGKRIVVIGSGATAISLVPELGQTAAHVTMLQRSPTYMLGWPSKEGFHHRLLMKLSSTLASRVAWWLYTAFATYTYWVSRVFPTPAKKFLVWQAMKRMPGQDVKHFTPQYDPWDERICKVKDDDLFDAVNRGLVSVVTDRIDHFTEGGIITTTGRELSADIVVSATGFNLKRNMPMGSMEVTVDGAPYDRRKACVYKGCMLSNVPNLFFPLGYSYTSWTLRSDLIAKYFCQMLRHMDQHGFCQCCPSDPDASVKTSPYALGGLQAGYVQRGRAEMPLQGDRLPWCVPQYYLTDRRLLSRCEDGIMQFGATAGRTSVKICASVLPPRHEDAAPVRGRRHAGYEQQQAHGPAMMAD